MSGTFLAAAMTASCSTLTGGTPVAQQTTASAASASTPTNSVVAPPSAPEVSEEDQVRETITAFQDAYNTQNWDAYTDLMCSAMRVMFTGPTMDYLKKNRADTGISTITAITSVSITGDTATATMDAQNEALGSHSITLPLKLEDGWKICQTY